MKKSVFIAALMLTGLTYKASDAQIRLHVGLNFGTAPVYEQAPPPPVEDVQYSDNDDYYYLPDADAYYDVNDQMYCYMEGNNWVRAAYLPGRYHDFDWRYARHYEIRGRRPFMHNDMYRSRFNGFAGGNPDWRMHDNRFNRGDFGPNGGGYVPGRQDRGGFAQRDGGFNGFNRPNGYGTDRGNRGDFNRNQQNGFNHDRGGFNQGQNNGYQNQGQYNGQGQNGQSHFGQGMNEGNGNQGQYNQPNRGQGGFQSGNSNNSQPSNNQGGHNWGGNNNAPQHLVSNNNGPAYNHQNGMFRRGGF